MQQDRGYSEESRVLAVTTISFDMSANDILVPLTSGATTVLACDEEIREPRLILELMRRHEITTMTATPTRWQMLLDMGWDGNPRLETIICGGEVLSNALAERLLSCSETVWDQYGPTEGTVGVSHYKVRSGEPITITRPIDNARLYVLDEDMVPVPIGSSGELYIGGAGVALGYRNHVELTQTKFLDNPFHAGKMYRTGDLVYFEALDRLRLVGRADRQVKVRGYRIELGEIESALDRNAGVKQAVVIVRDKRLIAYVLRDLTFGKHCSDGCSSTAMSFQDSIREWLIQRVPAYMVPSSIVELEAFPTTLNGKIDQAALPDASAVDEQDIFPASSVDGTECQILTIWSSILGHDRIGREDNFFHVGGDSSSLVRVQVKLEKAFDRKISTAKLFEHFTVKSLAAYLLDAADDPERRNSPPKAQNSEDDRIAVVSMACRLPGKVDTPEALWRLLERGEDVTQDIPKTRWDADAINDPDGVKLGSSSCSRGAFIDSVEAFDTSFFGISPLEGRGLDPAQYLMLEVSHEAVERAGYTARTRYQSQTGVFIGISSVPAYERLASRKNLDGYVGTGSAGSTMSGRISYSFGFEGPSMTVDTACSSSLVAIHLACAALRRGECETALAGGVSLLLTPGLFVEFSRLQGMSPDGRCRAFSASAQGTGWGEGAGVVMLKRLSDATRDGDTIQAIIRGSAVNHGGAGAGLTVPSGSAQRRLVCTALASSNLLPADVDYVEAHGTGTVLGDPIEATALAEVFSGSHSATKPLMIGSIKSNIGHTQAAAGVVGLMKVVLAMKHNVLPRTLNASEPTRAVDWELSNMSLVQQNEVWPTTEGRRRRAGVSGFGISGTNAHVVVEEPPKATAEQKSCLRSSTGPHLVLLSSHTKTGLREQAEKLWSHVKSQVESEDWIGNLSYSLATTRRHYQHRQALLVQDKDSLLQELKAVPDTRMTRPKREPRVAMLFTGQGCEMHGVGKDLAQRFPIFRDTLQEIERHFADELEKPLLDVLWAEGQSGATDLLKQTNYAQAVLFALQVALSRLWSSWGVEAEFVVGHSAGELAAAHVAGVLSLPDACRLVATRGRLMQSLPDNGRMVSIEASADEVVQTMNALGATAEGVEIAAMNMPMQTVASGASQAIEVLAAAYTAQGRQVKVLQVSHAFHSQAMDGILTEFEAAAGTVQYRDAGVPFVSTMTGTVAKPGEIQQPHYWARQMRRPVRFYGAMQSLSGKADIFIEVGPDAVLCSMGAACLMQMDSEEQDAIAWLPSMTQRGEVDKTERLAIARCLAELHVRGVQVDWEAYMDGSGGNRVELPTYAFERKQAWRSGKDGHGTAAPIGRGEDGEEEGEAHVEEGSEEAEKMRQEGLEYVVEWQCERRWKGEGEQDEEEEEEESAECKQAQVPVGRGGGRGRWGLLQGWKAVEWAAEIRAGLPRLVDVESMAAAEEMQLDGLLCLWEEPDMSCAADMASVALVQLQQAAAAASSVSSSSQLHVVWVTRRAIGVGPRDPPNGLGASPLWGLARTARNEHPDLALRMVDVDDDNHNNSEQIAIDHPESDRVCLRWALTACSEAECAIRERRLFVPRLKQLQASSSLSSQDINGNEGNSSAFPALRSHGGAVLITGGVGDLGSHVARMMASVPGVRKLVLTARRGLDAPDARELVSALSGQVEVAVVSSDVADRSAVASLLSAFDTGPPLCGIVHAAGVNCAGVLSTLLPEQCPPTFAPKVSGAWYLHELTRDRTLDFFVMFSSISGVMGMPGLGVYAAANVFLDSLAHLRDAQGLPATSLAYGTWQGGGMAASHIDATRAHLLEFGLDPLSHSRGLRLLARAVHRRLPLTIAAALDPGRLRRYLVDRGGIPPFLHCLLGRGQPPTDPGVQLRAALNDATLEGQSSLLLTMLRESVAKALGFARPEDVDVDQSLKSIGIDSLTAILLRNRLVALTGIALSANYAFVHPNLRALGVYLLQQIQEPLTDIDSLSTTTATSSSVVAADTSLTDVSSPPSSPAVDAPILDLKAIRRGCLDDAITFGNGPQNFDQPRSVLVTGCTGFVGAFIMHELLERGVGVYGLVRASTKSHAQQRLKGTLVLYDLWKPTYETLMFPVLGNITKPLLGLPLCEFQYLSHTLDAICHSAALVDWMRPLDDYVGPNIVSTHEVLRLASCGKGKTVHLVSTVATVPRHLGYNVSEDEYEYYYATSKFTAERMLAAARWRGARASAYRMPFVTASASSGHFRLDQGDFLHNLISGSIDMGCFPSLNANLSVVLPVDYLCRTMVNIVLDYETHADQDFDYANASAPTFTGFFELVIAAGAGEKVVAFDDWKEAAKAHAAANPTGPMARISVVLDACSAKDADVMFQSLPVGKHVLGGICYPAPPVDSASVHKYLDRIRDSRRTANVKA